MSSKKTPRRKVIISSDEEDSIEGSEHMKYGNGDDEVVSSSFRNGTGLDKESTKENSFQSFASSTPMTKQSQSRRFSDEGEISAIFSESFDSMSITSPIDSSRKDSQDDEEHDRSRSFVKSAEKEAVMSPFSQKLSQKSDAVSKQKLRERMFRKAVAAKKQVYDSPISKRYSTASSTQNISMTSVSSAKDNECSMVSTSSQSVTSQVSSSSMPKPNESKSRKVLNMDDLFESPMSSSNRSVSNSSLSSLKSFNTEDRSKFFTPRKVVVACDSDAENEEDDDDDVINLSENYDSQNNSNLSEDQVETSDIMLDSKTGEKAEDSLHDEDDGTDSKDDGDSERLDTDEENEEAHYVDVQETVDESFNKFNSGSNVEEAYISESESVPSHEASSPSIVILSDSEEEEDNSAKPAPSVQERSVPITTKPLNVVEPIQENSSLKKVVSPYQNESMEQLENRRTLLQKAFSRINISDLPDGGAKLKAQLAELDRIIQSRNEPKKYLPEIEILNVVESPSGAGRVPLRPLPDIVEITSPEKRGPLVLEPPKFNPDMYNKLLAKDTNRLFGGKMTENRFQKVQKITDHVLQNFHQALNSAPDEQDKVETPRGLRIELMEHQKQGLAWMLWRESQSPPVGILADDMGLGKTLSIISLIVHQKNERIKRKEDGNDDIDKRRKEAAKTNGLMSSNATLIVAPASLIYQWESEVERRVKHDRLSVHVFHGPKNKRESDARRLASYDIVITTYNLVGTELTEKVIIGNSDSDSDDGSGVGKKKSKNKIAKNSDSILAKIAWSRIVLDEAHAIKNKATSASKAACRLSGNARWCLTGTPIHNNLWDLYSLIRFMRVTPFDEEKHWKEFIMVGSQKAADRLNMLVKNLLLRRTKSQICAQTQKPLVDLPSKIIKRHDLVLEGIEGKIYDIMFTATQQKVKQMLSEEEDQRHAQIYGIHRKKRRDKGEEIINPFNFGPRKITENDRFQQMSGMLVMLLRLRQACVHMHLTRQAVDMNAFDNINGGTDDVDTILERTMAEMTIHEDFKGEEDNGETAEAVFENTHLSCKLKKLMEIISSMDANDKLVIVSQWTSLLDIVEIHIKNMKISYTSITGKVLPSDRQVRVDDFNKKNEGARIMLLSLSAGGVGLNLIGGNHLVLVDLHWNPALEAQACDRIYRMGQTKTVYIHRLVATGTIEQRVLDLQNKKLELAGAVLDGAASKKMNKLTMADLKYLFDLNDR